MAGKSPLPRGIETFLPVTRGVCVFNLKPLCIPGAGTLGLACGLPDSGGAVCSQAGETGEHAGARPHLRSQPPAQGSTFGVTAL